MKSLKNLRTIPLRVLFFVAVLSIIANHGQSQNLVCGSTEPSEAEIADREARVQLLKKNRVRARQQAGEFTYVPLRFHIVRRSDGTGGASTAQVNDALAKLNEYYRHCGIQFYLAGSTPNLINSDEYHAYEFSEETALAQANDLSNAINIYLVGSINFQSSSVTGYAYYPSVLAISNRVFIRTDRLTDARTLAHEMGHYFNVLHTFHNNAYQDVTFRELVTREAGSNCASAGDLLCDTPADPYGLPNSNTSGCSYVGTATDANGQLFSPMLTNMMSYYFSCGNAFTPGQYERMSGGLLLRTSPSNEYTLTYPGISPVPTQVVANQSADGVLVTFADAGADESGYIVERATSMDGPYVPVKGLDANVTSFLDATVVTNTLYYYRVRASNSTEYSVSDTAQVNLFYCKPTYYSPNSPMIIADFFLSKNGQNLISKINSGAGTNSYSDFSTMVADVTAGQSYSFIARAVTGGSGSFYPQHLSIWIDLDQNGVFDASDLVYQTTGNQYMSPSIQGSFTLSAQAMPGLTRMRVRSQYFTNGPVTTPCGQLNFGEAEDYTLRIISDTPPAILTTSLGSTSVCRGEGVQVSYTTACTFGQGNAFRVQLAGGLAGAYFDVPVSGSGSPLTVTLPDTLRPNIGYRVRVVATEPQIFGPEASQTITVLPRIEAVLSGGGSIAPGDSATLTITRTAGEAAWQFTLSDGLARQAGNAGMYTVKVAPAITTTYTLTGVQDDACGAGKGTGEAYVVVTAPATVNLQIRVFLEGPYRAATGAMITGLNQRGLLPGQTPIGTSATPTPPGQPYNRSPWNYGGGESVSNYQANVVDWILISLRAGSPSVNSTVFRTAALLSNDGWVTILNPPVLPANQSYYVVVEHRNHLGVLSHVPVTIQNNTLSYNFTTQDSYTATSPVSIGQKQVGTVFVVHTADGNKNVPNQDFVVNVNDYMLWMGANGRFDLYSEADFNMDAQISASDKVLWNNNNSKFSLIGRQ
jgi:hypothetical protein